MNTVTIHLSLDQLQAQGGELVIVMSASGEATLTLNGSALSTNTPSAAPLEGSAPAAAQEGRVSAAAQEGSAPVAASVLGAAPLCGVEGSAAPPPGAAPLLSVFMETVITQLRENGQQRTAETYRSALNSFRRFLEGGDVALTDISAQLARRYEQWLLQQGVQKNSTSFYMRILRATYNRAVAQRLTPDRRPFADVYTGIARTQKRAVGIDVIRRLRNMPLTDADECFARDMFLFSFYTQGMSFVDMAYAQTADRHDGLLTYRRQKTGQPVSITWTPQMQQLVDRHPSLTGRYLLPIIRSCTGRERSQLRRCQYMVNQQLGVLSARLQLPRKLTMYVARHSWASIAHELQVPLEVISCGMGHHSEQTTRIYLKTIDNGLLAEANRRIAQLLEE